MAKVVETETRQTQVIHQFLKTILQEAAVFERAAVLIGKHVSAPLGLPLKNFRQG